VAAHLAGIPEVLEAHTITGTSDLLCRMVARSNADLQRVIDSVVAYQGILRASTVIALATQIPYRTLPLVRVAASVSARSERSEPRSANNGDPVSARSERSEPRSANEEDSAADGKPGVAVITRTNSIDTG
jgi:hypothetical protein